MKRLVKVAVLLSVMAVAALSCVNDNITEPVGEELLEMLPSVEEQVSMMEASLSDIVELEKAARPHGVVLAEASEVLKSHVAVLKAGVTMEKGALATLDVQKKLAGVLGQAAAGLDGEVKKTLGPSLDEINAGICAWLGESFASYYPVAEAESRMKVLMSGLCETMDMQELYADALVSDVEAGLRKDEKPEELAQLVESVGQNSELADELEGSLSSLAAETEKEYRAALTGLFADPASFDAQALGEFNAGVETEVKSAAATLSDLMNRVAACDAKLEDIRTRLGAIEADINQLLEMIQSVEFMPENDSYNAVAYYDLDITKASSYEGKKQRIPAGTIEMCYLVRPAASANALVEAGIWNTGMKMIGYYADGQPVSTASMMDFAISDVVVNLQTGVVKVKMENNLSEAFYFKETKAKLALSLATGKADLTSKFVDIVPKDRSGNVYVETIRLSEVSKEVDNGQKTRIEVELSPANLTTDGVTWTSSNSDVATVSADGTVTGMSVGNVTITATTNGTDEWGNPLKAQCNVKVTPAIKLSGPSYIEEGSKVTIRIESPDYINPESVTWTSSAPSLAVIAKSEDGSAAVTGAAMYYNTTDKSYTPITLTCDIEDKVKLYHEIRVIAVQPKGIAIEGLSSGQNALTLKKGQEYTFNSTVQPAEVDMTLFRFRYQSNNAGVVNVPDISSGKVVANTIGSATVSVKVTDQGQYNYFYPARNEYVRYVDVTVEPYWVTGITLPSTWDMKPGEEVTLQAEFSSDGGDDVPPDDKTLTWTSDNTDVVEVDPSTGKMTAKAAGAAIIKATTSGSLSVPNGTDHKSASCVVNVREATAADPKVGDYYYSDGTWGNDATRDDIIGVIFSTEPAIGTDVMLRNQYPTCSHGLVVSTIEYNENMGYIPYQDTFFKDNSYDLSDDSSVLGFTYTYYMKEFAQYKGDGLNYDTHYAELFRNDVGVVAKHTAIVSSPASPWYVPSCAEMKLLYEVKTSVNASLAAINGNQISDVGYWMSNSVRLTKSTKWWDPDGGALFNMETNSLDSIGSYNTPAKVSANYPVRVVLAF